MIEPFDRDRLQAAFELLGEHLAERGTFVEVAVYGGGAAMMQFEWRRATFDVDAVVREGYDEAALAPSVAWVASQMNLDADWLNNAVGMFTPLVEVNTLFQVAGSYPSGSKPGLRVLVASPEYLLAMKLNALANYGRGDKDLDDARRLAEHLGLTTAEAMRKLHLAIYDEEPPAAAAARFASILGD